MRATTLLDEGYSQAEVARELGVTQAAVSQWVKARRKGGDEALRAKPHPGRGSVLNPRQIQKLEQLLVKGARANGYANELWTLGRVRALIKKHFGAKYTTSGVWYVLRRMGWSCQKPERRARERDENAIAVWRKKDWPRIKKRATKR